jgi:hypothetical protein
VNSSRSTGSSRLEGVAGVRLRGGQARVFGTARVTFLPDGTLFFDEERVRLTPL